MVFIDDGELQQLTWEHGTENPHRRRARGRVHDDVKQVEPGGVGVFWAGTPDSIHLLRRELHVFGRCGAFFRGLLTAGSEHALFFRPRLLSNNVV